MRPNLGPWPIVKLDDKEMDDAHIWGPLRKLKSEGLDPGQSVGFRSDEARVLDEVAGVAAEMAWAKYLSVPYDLRLNNFASSPDHMADVGDIWEVKSSPRRRGTSCLLRLHEYESFTKKGFLCVVVNASLAPIAELIGIISPERAMRHGDKTTKFGTRDMWFVPAYMLTPIPEDPAAIDEAIAIELERTIALV